MPSRIEQIPRVFFAAMRAYAGNMQNGTIREVPGLETVLFEVDCFKACHYFVAAHGRYKFEQIIILCDGEPAWTMSWYGWCVESAIPFLGRALRKAYDQRGFFGGRGPKTVPESGMLYMNSVEQPSSWRRFNGQEEIFDHDDRLIGWHRYQGILLLE